MSVLLKIPRGGLPGLGEGRGGGGAGRVSAGNCLRGGGLVFFFGAEIPNKFWCT